MPWYPVCSPFYQQSDLVCLYPQWNMWYLGIPAIKTCTLLFLFLFLCLINVHYLLPDSNYIYTERYLIIYTLLNTVKLVMRYPVMRDQPLMRHHLRRNIVIHFYTSIYLLKGHLSFKTCYWCDMPGFTVAVLQGWESTGYSVFCHRSYTY